MCNISGGAFHLYIFSLNRQILFFVPRQLPLGEPVRYFSAI